MLSTRMKKKGKKNNKPKSKQKRKTGTAPADKKGVGMPYGDRVLVKPMVPEEVTSFGLIIPETAKEKPEQGVVIAVGPGRKGDTGDLIPVAVQVGDRVMFNKYGYDEVKIGGTEYYLIAENNILMVLNK